MDKKRFEIGDAVSFGWETMKANMGFLVLAVLIMWLAVAIFSGPQGAVGYNSVAAIIIAAILSILAFIMGILVNIAQVKIGLRYCDGQKADFPDLYEGYPKFVDVLIGGILYGLLVLAGLILFIIPGIYWGIRYHFFVYLIIDRDMSPVEAIKKSGDMTRGIWWHLFVFWLAIIGINLIGAILCCVGLLFTIPITLVAIAYVYRTLLSETPQAQVTDAFVPPPEVPPASGTPPATV